MLARQRHNPLEEIQLDALRGGVAWKTQDHHLGLRDGLTDGALQFIEEIDARRHAHRANVGTRNHRAVNVDRVARVGHQHGVPAIERSQHEMRQPFLGADGHDGFGIGVDVDRIPALVPVGNGLAQAGNALGHGVAVCRGAHGSFDQLVDNMLRRGAIRIAHAHVDNVFAPAPRGHFQFGRDVEHVGWKTLDAGEFAL